GRESYLDALSDAVGRARLALGRVAYLRSRLSALEESLAAARQVLELQRSRFDHGDLSGNDYDRLALDTMVLESDAVQNRADFDAALGMCQAALYAPCDPGQMDLGVLDDAAAVAVPEGWEDALDRRPDVRALDLLAESAKQDAKLARRRAIPDPSLSLGYA